MTNSQPHTSGPSSRQLAYLRRLAERTGQSFAYPRTFAEADAEIKRLRREQRTPADERRREVRAIRDDMARGGGDAARVRTDELGGYGSEARWLHQTRD